MRKPMATWKGVTLNEIEICSSQEKLTEFIYVAYTMCWMDFFFFASMENYNIFPQAKLIRFWVFHGTSSKKDNMLMPEASNLKTSPLQIELLGFKQKYSQFEANSLLWGLLSAFSVSIEWDNICFTFILYVCLFIYVTCILFC